MKYYLVQAAEGHPPQLAYNTTQAKIMCRQRGFKSNDFTLYIVPDEKEARMDYINRLLARDPGVAATLPAPTPLPPSTQSESEPAPLTQATVDEWFEPASKKQKPTLDEVCACISSYEGAALGHVAHELAARIQKLADFIKG